MKMEVNTSEFKIICKVKMGLYFPYSTDYFAIVVKFIEDIGDLKPRNSKKLLRLQRISAEKKFPRGFPKITYKYTE